MTSCDAERHRRSRRCPSARGLAPIQGQDRARAGRCGATGER